MSNFPVDIFFTDPDMLEDVVWTSAGVATTLKAHFFSPYEPTTFGDIAIQNSKPSVIVRTSDVPGIVHAGNTITVKGKIYNVHEVKPDGTGLTTIELVEP